MLKPNAILKPNIQLFAEGEGESAGGEGGQPETFTKEQLDNAIADSVRAAREAAISEYHTKRGATEEEVSEALKQYREGKGEETPNVEEIQQQLNDAQQTARQAVVEKTATLEALALGIDVKSIPFVLRATDLSKAVKEDGTVDDKAVKTALEAVTKEVPGLKAKSGGKQFGAGEQEQTPAGRPSIKAALSKRLQ